MKSPISIEVKNYRRSPPSRGAWIEISSAGETEYCLSVAPLAGGVD